jgi:hypothetical protein
MSLSHDIAIVFGSIAFILHLCGYVWYSLTVLSGKTKPNAASWLMWLFGAWVEFKTFDAIDHHWSSSALPFACMLGVGLVFFATLVMQLRSRISGSNHTIYEESDPRDYLLVGADAGAYALFLMTGAAAWANWIAVGSSVVTFYPIWKTTYRSPENERPWPWLIWSAAYTMMFLAVLAEGGEEVFAKSFYPIFYLALHLPVALLCWPAIRSLFAATSSNEVGTTGYHSAAPGGVLPSLNARLSGIHGEGVFAGEYIAAGRTIGPVNGVVVSMVNSSRDDSLANPNWFGVGFNRWIDPEPPFLLLNHSCSPNVGAVSVDDERLLIVALSNILSDEELTIDYSTIEGDPQWEMECKCGTRNCRETIRSIVSLPADRYYQYLPHIPRYFQLLYQKASGNSSMLKTTYWTAIPLLSAIASD